MGEPKLDTVYTVETPEAIDLVAQLAGPIPRMAAFSLDFLIRLGALLGLSILALALGRAAGGFLLIAWFVLEWLYPVFFEIFRRGQTPGKKAFGLAVVNSDLTPVTLGPSLTRNLLRAADFMPLCYVFGFTAMTMSSRFQRLGDMAAGTVVIHVRKASGERMDLPTVAAVAPPVELTLDEQEAIILFAQRHRRLARGRQQELAAILAPVVGQPGAKALATVQGMGRWLLGARD